MYASYDTDVIDFVNFCNSVAKHKLVVASSGNASVRYDDDRMMITTSGQWLESMKYDDVSFVHENKTTLKPSTELPVHKVIYNQRPDAKIVLHFQSPAATAISCMDLIGVYQPTFNIIPEIVYYFKHIDTIRYAKPGSIELINLVGEAFKKADLVIAQSHGIFVIGSTYEQTLRRAIFFELACDILLKIGVDNWPKVRKISN